MTILKGIFLFSIIFSELASAMDLEQVVSGAEVENSLENSKAIEPSPFVIEGVDNGIEKQKISADSKPDFMFNEHSKEIPLKENAKNKFQDLSYTAPGTFDSREDYLETDKKAMAEEFRKNSSGSLNISFIKDDYIYTSNNDIINKTIGEGYKHVKGGAIYLRSDQYFRRTDSLNPFWSLGAGLGFNSGKGLFVTGDRSDTTFRLWEVPLDLGIGLEVPVYHWFKVAACAGPSALLLYQNRSDFEAGEKGRNKGQYSLGEFVNAQFKVNLMGFSYDAAYDLFTESKITNLYMNLEARYQSYAKFQDPVRVEGASFGIGFTFEYL